MVVPQQRLIDLAAVGVRNGRIVGLAVACAVVRRVAQAADVVGLDQRGQAIPLTGLEADAGAQRLRIGMFQRVVLVDVLVAIAQIQNRLGIGEQIAEVLAGEDRRTAEQPDAKQAGCQMMWTQLSCVAPLVGIGANDRLLTIFAIDSSQG